MTARARAAIAILLITLLLAIFAANAYLASLDKCATVDEPGPLIASWVQIHFHDFRDDCEDPPVWQRLIASGLADNLFSIDRDSVQWQSLLRNADAQAPLASEALYHTPGLDADTLLRFIRIRMISVAVILGIVIAWWAWKFGGPFAAVFAVAFFTFDPTVLANAPQIKNDIPLSLAFILLMASVWRFGERATVVRLLLLILFMTGSFLTKFSGFLAIPIVALALLARSLVPRPWPVGRCVAGDFKRRLAVSAGAFSIALLCLWIFTWASYDFRFLPTADSADQYDFDAALQSLANHQAFAQSADPYALTPADLANFRARWRPPIPARIILFANAHRLLPQSCLIGMLRIDAVSQSRVTFLLGKSSVTGWWYYFPLAILFKTPIATLIALLATAVLILPRIRRTSSGDAWASLAVVIFPAVYFAVAMKSNVNVGIRHMLPVYTFLFISLGVAAGIAWSSARRAGRLMVIVVLISLAAESASAFPNYIPFFNAFCGGPRGGLRLLSESNLDWGQDLPALADWQSHHADRPLFLLYWGSADPRYYGIRYVNLPESTASPDLTAPGPGRCVYAISAVVLTNPFVRARQKDFFDSIQRQSPIAILNGTIYIYDAP